MSPPRCASPCGPATPRAPPPRSAEPSPLVQHRSSPAVELRCMVATGQGWFADGVKEPTMPGIGRVRVAGLVRVFGASPHSSPGVLPMGRKVVTIGRDPDCELPLNDGATSRRHARIERRGEHHYLVDLD